MQKQLNLREFGFLIIGKNRQHKLEEKLMKCPFCYSIVFEQKYCPNCGRRLKG